MMPHEPTRDMMRRTMKNLEFIESHAKIYGLFEVTQLVNSFLSALAHPWEVHNRSLSLCVAAQPYASKLIQSASSAGLRRGTLMSLPPP